MFDTSSEAMIYQNGEPCQGLTGGHGGDRRVTYPLTRNAQEGQRYLNISYWPCSY
jgi:hypothetical protein